MNELFYIKYEPRLMLLDCLDLPPLVELAHRRLCDWVWVQGRCPPLAPQILRDITRMAPADWPCVLEGLQRKGWNERNGHLEHGAVLRTLHEAKATDASAAGRGVKGARGRWRRS